MDVRKSSLRPDDFVRQSPVALNNAATVNAVQLINIIAF